MNQKAFPDILDEAANALTALEKIDLPVLLRRSAIRLRNSEGMSFDDDIEEALVTMCTKFEVDRKTLIRRIVRHALEAIHYLPGKEPSGVSELAMSGEAPDVDAIFGPERKKPRRRSQRG